MAETISRLTPPCLRLEGLRVVLGGRPVLALGSLQFPAGALSCIEGENGSGKTTLLLAAAGLLDLQAGRILWDDQVFHQGKAPAPIAHRQATAFVFQRTYLLSGTVANNIDYGLRCRHIPKQIRHQRIGEILKRLDIEDLARRPSSQLSGGEQKLVGLARALVLEPKMLFLDEPTAALDTGTAQHIEGILADLARSQTMTVVMATHDHGLAARISSNRFELREGKQAV
jgi:tungstate transport system ATP-binding protein